MKILTKVSIIVVFNIPERDNLYEVLIFDNKGMNVMEYVVDKSEAKAWIEGICCNHNDIKKEPK